MLHKVISGGQTGADISGLYAAKAAGFNTGGTAPPNYQTEIGRLPELLKSFGLVEGESDLKVYPKRTKRNVLDSDGTVIFGFLTTPGCRLTVRLAKELCKPCLANPSEDQLLSWLEKHRIQTLNVAGNRESVNFGIEDRVCAFLTRTLIVHRRQHYGKD